jgi:hypothetical protein
MGYREFTWLDLAGLTVAWGFALYIAARMISLAHVYLNEEILVAFCLGKCIVVKLADIRQVELPRASFSLE